MPGLPNSIIDSFEEIGKSIVSETAKIPKDIAGKALESLGGTSKSQPVQPQPEPTAEQANRPKDSWDDIGTQQNMSVKKTIAREALAALAARRKPQDESVWERLQKEQEQKKMEQNKRDAEQRAQALPATKGKRPVGDLYGLKAKRQGSEIGKNVKSE
jgi:hypothetical protein